MFLRRIGLNWKYAIGEIALITIGVLLAFAVEDWRGFRSDRQLEAEYLARIESDVRSAIDAWHSHAERLQSAIQLLQGVRSGAFDALAEYEGQDVWSAYNISHWSYLPAITTSAFEELVSTGRLALIEDIELRNAISEFYSVYANGQNWTLRHASDDYSRLARSAIPHEVVYAADVEGTYDISAIRSALEQLSSRPAFDDVSNAQLSWQHLVIGTLQIYEVHANRLLDQINRVSDSR